MIGDYNPKTLNVTSIETTFYKSLVKVVRSLKLFSYHFFLKRTYEQKYARYARNSEGTFQNILLKISSFNWAYSSRRIGNAMLQRCSHVKVSFLDPEAKKNAS